MVGDGQRFKDPTFECFFSALFAVGNGGGPRVAVVQGVYAFESAHVVDESGGAALLSMKYINCQVGCPAVVLASLQLGSSKWDSFEQMLRHKIITPRWLVLALQAQRRTNTRTSREKDL